MKTLLISHFYNEELLLPSWCLHHRDMFDVAVVIDHSSTDKSCEIIEKLCPNWIKVRSKLSQFDCAATDQEVMFYERQYPDHWKLCLNTTEFLWTRYLDMRIDEFMSFYPDTEAFGMSSFCLVDSPKQSKGGDGFDGYFTVPFYLGKTWGYKDQPFGFNVSRFRRFIHRGLDGQYDVGRHSTKLSSTNTEALHILHATYSPWPYCRERKLQIQGKMPESDKAQGKGVQHIVSPEQLNARYLQHLGVSKDLLEYHEFRGPYEHFYRKFNV